MKYVDEKILQKRKKNVRKDELERNSHSRKTSIIEILNIF